MTAKLIGIYSPAAGSGKSTFANVLMQNYGFKNVKFADPLKNMVRALLAEMQFDKRTVERMIEGNLKEQVIPGFSTVTPRHLMQTLGTDWGREAVDNGLWLKVARRKIERLLSQGHHVVVDDLRFPNEWDLLDDMGATLVRLVRQDPSVTQGDTRYEGLLCEFPFDRHVLNNGDIEELRFKANMVAQQCIKE